MHPALPAGSRIRIRCGENAALAPGDVIALVADPPIVHRVVGLVRRGPTRFVITRGDAVCFCDLPVPPSGILGVVEACDTGGRWRPVGVASRSGGSGAVVRQCFYQVVRASLLIDERLAAVMVRAVGALGALAGRVVR